MILEIKKVELVLVHCYKYSSKKKVIALLSQKNTSMQICVQNKTEKNRSQKYFLHKIILSFVIMLPSHSHDCASCAKYHECLLSVRLG